MTRCVQLQAATVHYRDDVSNAAEAKVSSGTTDRRSGWMRRRIFAGDSNRRTYRCADGDAGFDEHNQPHHGHLQDGVTIDSDNNGRKMHGTSPTMELVFAEQGELRSAHLERGVQIVSDEESVGEAERFTRIGHGCRRWRMWPLEIRAKAR